MRVEVTQADIDRGMRVDPSRCPVALAILRATGGREGDVMAGRSRAVFGTREEPAGVTLPAAARAFIARLDEGEPVAPFAFDWPEYDRAIAATAATKEADPMGFLFETLRVMLPYVWASLAILLAGYLAFLWYTATR